MAQRLLSFAFICLFITVAVHPAIAHPGAAIVVDAKGQVYFVDTGHGVWMVYAAGKLVDLGGPAFHWMTLDFDGRFAGLRVQGGSFEFVAKAVDGGVLILSSDFPVALGNGSVYFAPYAKTPPLRVLRLTARWPNRTRRCHRDTGAVAQRDSLTVKTGSTSLKMPP